MKHLKHFMLATVLLFATFASAQTVWTQQNLNDTNELYAVTWGNSQFMAVGGIYGSNPTLLTSPNGITWTARNSGGVNQLYNAVWTGTQFVVVGLTTASTGSILTSPDGITWTTQSTAAHGLRAVAWTGSQLVAVGNTGIVITSPDGVTWTTRTSGATLVLSYIIWTGSQLVAVGANGNIYTSPDGVTWTKRTSGTTSNFLAAAWTGSQLVVAGTNGTILTSPTGVTWTARTSGTTTALEGLVWTGSQLVAVGGDDNGSGNGTVNVILTSPDGITWTTQNSGTTNPLHSVAWNGSQFVASGVRGTILTLPQNAPTTPTLNSPSTGALNIPRSTFLSWNASSGATSYRVQVSTDPSFTTTQIDDSTITGVSRTLSSLSNGTVYYWRVRAKNGGGAGDYSQVNSFTTVAADNENYSQWTYSKTLTLNTTSASAGVTSAQTNFPLLVRLSNSHKAVFQQAAAGGADIRFSNGSGTHLPYQIERWSAISSDTSAAIWVQADIVNANGATTIKMYWGNGSATSRSSGPDVFSNGFHSVWHLGDTTNADPRPNAVGRIKATPRNFPAGYTPKAGVIGMADSLRGGRLTDTVTRNNGYFNISGEDYANWSNGITFSVWGYQKQNAGSTLNYTYLLELANATSWQDNIQFYRPASGTGTTARIMRYEGASGTLGQGYQATPAGSLILNAWHHYAVKVNGTSVAIYIDGVSQTLIAGTSPSTPNVTAPAPGVQTAAIKDTTRSNGYIGRSNYTTDSLYAGMLDEPELSNVARSDDWIKLEYKNQMLGSMPLFDLVYSSPSPVYTTGVAISTNSPAFSGTSSRFTIDSTLPAGLSFNNGNGSITGTPTAAFPSRNYTVTAYGDSSWSTTTTLNLAVVPPVPTNLSYSKNPAVYGVGIAITSNTSAVTGTVTHYSANPALPVGLSLDTVTGVISGTPTTGQAATNDTITASNSNGSTTTVLSIAVRNPIASFGYPRKTLELANNVALIADTPSITGIVPFTPVTYFINRTLPAGLTLDTNTGILSGTPTTAQSDSTYIVTAKNGVSAFNKADTLHILILNPPVSLSYSANPAVYGVNKIIENNIPTINTPISKYSIAPLPSAGLSFDTTTGILSGTPTTAQSQTNYLITAANVAGTDTETVRITVLDVPISVAYTTPVIYGVNIPIPNDSPSVTGTVTHYSISPALPAGLTLDSNTGILSGTPTVAKALTNYSILASNVAGFTSTNITMTVLAKPANLVYPAESPVYGVNVPIMSDTPTVTGTVTQYSISPALPTGLSFDTTKGIISGTPSAIQASTAYIITATNLAGSDTETVRITVLAIPANLSYTTPVVYGVNAPIANDSPTVTGTVTKYSVTPTLPAGLVLDSNNGILSGTPAVTSASTNYIVTAANIAGFTTANLNIAVLASPANLTYATPVIYGVGITATPNTPTVTGTVTKYSVTPALPGGLKLDSVTGVLSGIATGARAAANYIITATNVAGSAIDTVNIRVVVAPVNLSYVDDPTTYVLGVAITPNNPSVTGFVSKYSSVPSLPPGLKLDSTTGVISGIPTGAQSFAANYTITAKNVAGQTQTAITTSIVGPPSNLSYADDAPTYGRNTLIKPPNTPVVRGIVTFYSISPALPAGIVFDQTTGYILGTPTALSSPTDYTITAQNPGGTAVTTINLGVVNPP